MASFSDYTENKVLDHIFGATAWTPPVTLYFALFTAAPSDAGGGIEVTGGSYARAAVTNNTTNFPNASGGAKSNGTTITFPTPSGSWGTVTHMGVFDASSGGNLIAWAPLTASQVIGTGNTVTFPIGDFDVTLT